MSLIYLDEYGNQVIISNIIKSNGKKAWVEYYGINTGTHKRVTPVVKNKKLAEKLLTQFAKGDMFTPALDKSSGWPTCFSMKCLTCNYSSCDGKKALNLRLKHNGYIPPEGKR
jgi:hypothetical protein